MRYSCHPALTSDSCSAQGGRASAQSANTWPDGEAVTIDGKSKTGEVFDLELPVVNPEGIRTADEFPNITAGLLARGYDPQDAQKTMGINFLRMLEPE